jgi:hypothetical protein
VPTYERSPRFRRDYQRLTPEQRRQFRNAVGHFVEDARQGMFRKGLRVKPFRGKPGWFEMTWAPDGRALFQYGESVVVGEPHIIWLRIGGHEIFDNP